MIQPPDPFGDHDAGRNLRGYLEDKGDFPQLVEGDDAVTIIETFSPGIP